MQLSRKLDTIATPDVLVCGAGCAGTVAAITAARNGASVMVIERFGFAGGYITGVVGISFDGWVDLRSGLPVVGGVVAEFAREAAGRDDVMGASFSPCNELREMRETPNRAKIRFNIERFKRQADRLFAESGARVLYYTQVADVIREGERIAGVVVANKAGLGVIRPKVVVDATGDADVAAFAGAPFAISAERQPMSLHLRIANVTIDDDTRDQCSDALREAKARGELGVYGGPWIGRMETESEVYINSCRYPGDGTDPDDLTKAEIQGRLDAEVMFRAFKSRVPGFRDSYLVATGPFVGVRESRRILGEKTLTREDIEQERLQPDAIALGAWWLDRHPNGHSGYHVHELVRPYDIAYGTLVARGVENLLVAGRCHSADSDALASSRVTVTCMGMGEAAGTAAALASRDGGAVRGFPVAELQRRLMAQGAIILDRAQEVLAMGDAVVEKPLSAVR
jgi:glycine/D-amino acid oxidase-like deaminating enzyme